MRLSVFFSTASLLLFLAAFSPAGRAQEARTWCNPMNLDYAYSPIPDFSVQGNHRATADPVITLFRGEYYLFSTNQWGYWWSADMLRWTFVPRKFLEPWRKVYDDLCAPAVFSLGDTLMVIGSTYTHDFPLWMSTDPHSAGSWRPRVDSFEVGAWDPDFFVDDDGRLFLYYGSSNVYPIYGQEIDRTTFRPVGPRKDLIRPDGARHGWERFGEANDNTFLNPFVEGAWMTKHAGKYYLQYGAPGTEFSGYADGVYVGDAPLGPFAYQSLNPFSYKPGGFARGAGHGSTFSDRWGNWWHVSTMSISVKNNFERRLGLFPAAFDADGLLHTATAYGDYPHTMPSRRDTGSLFTGWMLLDYMTPVRVSSALGGHPANFAVDENIRTYWSAASADSGEWIEVDCGKVCDLRAVQINYADEDAVFLGKQEGITERYVLYGSTDEKEWKTLVDKSRNTADVPHDYVELPKPEAVRYVRLVNIHVPSGKFAISGLRLFGDGRGKKPDEVKHFTLLRGESERRNVWIKWEEESGAQGYVIYAGLRPDKLYLSMMVNGANEYVFRGMDRDRIYYFAIEAFNENGIGPRTTPLAAE